MKANEILRELQKQVYINTDDCEITISKDCYKAVISALEFRVPEIPIPRGLTNEYRCPSCNDILREKYRCCQHCGQRLLWE